MIRDDKIFLFLSAIFCRTEKTPTNEKWKEFCSRARPGKVTPINGSVGVSENRKRRTGRPLKPQPQIESPLVYAATPESPPPPPLNLSLVPTGPLLFMDSQIYHQPASEPVIVVQVKGIVGGCCCCCCWFGLLVVWYVVDRGKSAFRICYNILLLLGWIEKDSSRLCSELHSRIRKIYNM